MNKVIILSGLPASGKSTFCNNYQHINNHYLRVNKDMIREMIGVGYDYNVEEDVIKRLEVKAFDLCISMGYNVIVDDTNLKEGNIENWIREAKGMGITDENIQVIYFNESLEECLKRNSKRSKKVPKAEIEKMFNTSITLVTKLLTNKNIIKYKNGLRQQ